MPENDLLQNPAFRAPGLGERLRELFLGEKRPLDCVQVEVTSCCAGRCVYCPHTTQTGSWRSRHMPDEVFAALWPLLRRSGRAHLQGWGEPLLHPRFFDFAALARKAGCRVSSTSCGLHMDADLAARLVESGMDMLAFSLVGTDAASNAARAGVSFERVCEAIRMVRAAQRGRSGRAVSGENFPEVHLAYLMLADRIEAAAGLPRLMEELDVRMAVVSTLDYIAAPSQAVLAFAPEETDKIARARAKQIAFDEAFACGIPIRHALMIGGGGCAWPKHAATNHPELVVDVVEEDARVIDIARKFFFVEEFECTGQVRMIAAEGRAYLEQPGPTYDAIVNDAFSGTEPVRSLATVEAARAIARRLNPGGVYLSNVVSENGGVHIEFLRDAAASLREVFSNVQVLPCPDFGYSDEDNYLLAASNSDVSFEGALPFSDEFLGTPLRD